MSNRKSSYRFIFLAVAFFVIAMTVSTASAQAVSTYTFAESAGAYAVLGGTNSTATGDDGIQNGVPIGFNFNMGGTIYANFCINTNGWIKLGTSATPCVIGGSGWVNSLGNAATHRPLIAALWDDNHRNTGAITYSTTGAAGSQILTVDWNNVNIGGGGSTSAVNLASYQIKIYETTNVVEIIYSGTLALAGALSGSVGLNDNTSFLSVTPGAPGTASGAVANNAIAATTDMVSKMYTFTPPPPAPGTLQLSSATYAGNENTTLAATVNRVSGSAGIVGATYTLTDGSATGGAACTAGVDYINPGPTLLSFGDLVASQPINVTLCPDAIVDVAETFTITISLPTGGALLGAPLVATATINDVLPPLSGTYSIPTDFPSLTLAGGIFERINTSGTTGPITINITADLTGETGAFPLNPIAGNPTVLIKPSDAPRTISGIAPIAVIRINGADNIRIDGSTAAAVVGGNPALRELTVQNLSTSTSSGVIHIGSATESSTGNTVQNVNISGNDPTQTVVGIGSGGGAVGSPATFPNNNTRILNCSVRRAVFGIFSSGVAATPNTGTVISENDLTGLTTERIRRVGILVFNDNGVQITQNSVGGIDNTGESADAIGIGVGTQGISEATITSGGVSNANVNRNKVNGVSQDATFSAAGITVAGGTLGANIISNNMVTGVIADSTLGDLVAGIFVVGAAGSNTRLYYNSVSMTGDRSALLTPGTGMLPSYGIAITGADPTVELKNNIVYTSQTADLIGSPAALSFGVGMVATTFVNLDSNYNVFFSTGANDGGFRTTSLGNTGGVNVIDLPTWRTTTGGGASDDFNSGEGDPNFVNPLTDLHIQIVSPLTIDMGIAVSVLDDFDGSIRSVVGLAGGIPDIGGDERIGPSAADASIGGRVTTASGQGIRNAVIVVTGNALPQPIFVRTGSFGYYKVEGLEVGETYVVTVVSKRFMFSSPSRIISLTDSITDADFIADPQ